MSGGRGGVTEIHMSTDSYAGQPAARRGGKHEPNFNSRLFLPALVGLLGATLSYAEKEVCEFGACEGPLKSPTPWLSPHAAGERQQGTCERRQADVSGKSSFFSKGNNKLVVEEISCDFLRKGMLCCAITVNCRIHQLEACPKTR